MNEGCSGPDGPVWRCRPCRATTHPAKRRTRAHVIAAQSRNLAERCIIDEGYVSESVREDYGYDLVMTTYDQQGYIEEGQVLIQLKATDKVLRTARGIAVTVDVRDYRLWTSELMPVFLVMYDGVGRKAYWVYVQNYFQTDPACRPRPGAKTVRVILPEANEVGPAFVQYARIRKAQVVKKASGGIDHAE